jgi:hypothetical protein
MIIIELYRPFNHYKLDGVLQQAFQVYILKVAFQPLSDTMRAGKVNHPNCVDIQANKFIVVV